MQCLFCQITTQLQLPFPYSSTWRHETHVNWLTVRSAGTKYFFLSMSGMSERASRSQITGTRSGYLLRMRSASDLRFSGDFCTAHHKSKNTYTRHWELRYTILVCLIHLSIEFYDSISITNECGVLCNARRENQKARLVTSVLVA